MTIHHIVQLFNHLPFHVHVCNKLKRITYHVLHFNRSPSNNITKLYLSQNETTFIGIKDSST